MSELAFCYILPFELFQYPQQHLLLWQPAVAPREKGNKQKAPKEAVQRQDKAENI